MKKWLQILMKMVLGKIKSQLSTKFKYLRHVITKSEVRFYRVSKAGFNHVD